MAPINPIPDSNSFIDCWDLSKLFPTSCQSWTSSPQVSARVLGLQSKGEGSLAGLLPEVSGLHAAVRGLLSPPCPGLARDHPR